jgi:hypothetical protein
VAGVAENNGTRSAIGTADVQHRNILIDWPGQVAHARSHSPAVDAEARRPLGEGEFRWFEALYGSTDEIDDLIEHSGRIPPDHGFLLGIDIFGRP